MINLFKNYINWHIKNLVKLFTDNLYKKNEDSYVKLFNFIFWFKGIDDRIKYLVTEVEETGKAMNELIDTLITFPGVLDLLVSFIVIIFSKNSIGRF